MEAVKDARMWVVNARKAVAGFQMLEISGGKTGFLDDAISGPSCTRSELSWLA